MFSLLWKKKKKALTHLFVPPTSFALKALDLLDPKRNPSLRAKSPLSPNVSSSNPSSSKETEEQKKQRFLTVHTTCVQVSEDPARCRHSIGQCSPAPSWKKYDIAERFLFAALERHPANLGEPPSGCPRPHRNGIGRGGRGLWGARNPSGALKGFRKERERKRTPTSRASPGPVPGAFPTSSTGSSCWSHPVAGQCKETN